MSWKEDKLYLILVTVRVIKHYNGIKTLFKNQVLAKYEKSFIQSYVDKIVKGKMCLNANLNDRKHHYCCKTINRKI